MTEAVKWRSINNKQHEGADNLPPAESHILAPGTCRLIIPDVASLNAIMPHWGTCINISLNQS